jgi:alanine racemase
LTSDFAREGGVLTIDLAAIRSNYRLLRGRIGSAECGAVVKADRYGLGAETVARALFAEGCRVFFTAHLAEAIALRPALPAEAWVVVLHGPPPGTASDFVAHGLVPVLNSVSQVAEWSALAGSLGRRLSAWLQVDSGMSRFGLSEAEIEGLALDGVEVETVMSHLACADTPAHPANAAQLACFARMRARFPDATASFSASSGIFLGPDYHFDIVRPGAALYGVNPCPGAPNPLAPAIRLQGRVMQVRAVKRGTAIGYGHTVKARRATRLATVAVGYADGFLRSTGASGGAWLDGVRMPLMGRVSMDSIIVDAGDAALQPGDLVDLIGPQHDADAAGAAAGTIGYEILTSLGHRFARRIIGAA